MKKLVFVGISLLGIGFLLEDLCAEPRQNTGKAARSQRNSRLQNQQITKISDIRLETNALDIFKSTITGISSKDLRSLSRNMLFLVRDLDPNRDNPEVQEVISIMDRARKCFEKLNQIKEDLYQKLFGKEEEEESLPQHVSLEGIENQLNSADLEKLQSIIKVCKSTPSLQGTVSDWNDFSNRLKQAQTAFSEMRKRLTPEILNQIEGLPLLKNLSTADTDYNQNLERRRKKKRPKKVDNESLNQRFRTPTQSDSDEQPSASENPISDEQTNISEPPISDNQRSRTLVQSDSNEQPSASEQPVSDEQTNISVQPISDNQRSRTPTQSDSDEQPSASEQPVLDEETNISEPPISDNQRSRIPTQSDSDEQPSASEQPVSDEQTNISVQPISDNQRSRTPTQSDSDEQPSASEQPVLDEQINTLESSNTSKIENTENSGKIPNINNNGALDSLKNKTLDEFYKYLEDNLESIDENSAKNKEKNKLFKLKKDLEEAKSDRSFEQKISDIKRITKSYNRIVTSSLKTKEGKGLISVPHDVIKSLKQTIYLEVFDDLSSRLKKLQKNKSLDKTTIKEQIRETLNKNEKNKKDFIESKEGREKREIMTDSVESYDQLMDNLFQQQIKIKNRNSIDYDKLGYSLETVISSIDI